MLVFSVLSMKSVSLYISIVSFDQSILISSFKDYTFLSSVLHIEYKLRTARVDRSGKNHMIIDEGVQIVDALNGKVLYQAVQYCQVLCLHYCRIPPDAESEDNTEEEVEEVDGATANELDSEEE